MRLHHCSSASTPVGSTPTRVPYVEGIGQTRTAGRFFKDGFPKPGSLPEFKEFATHLALSSEPETSMSPPETQTHAQSDAQSPTQNQALGRARIRAPGTRQADARGYVRVSVRKQGSSVDTTVSVSAPEWRCAMVYTKGNARAVTDALRHVARRLTPGDVLPHKFSLVVRRKALARLRGLIVSPAAVLAFENNKAWPDAQ